MVIRLVAAAPLPPPSRLAVPAAEPVSVPATSVPVSPIVPRENSEIVPVPGRGVPPFATPSVTVPARVIAPPLSDTVAASSTQLVLATVSA